MKKHINQRIIYIMTLVFIFSCSNNFVFSQADTIGTSGIQTPPPPPPPPLSCFGSFFHIGEMPVWGMCGDKPKNEQRACSNKAIATFIQDHLRYPEEALSKKITGTAVASFIVDKDGSMKDIKLVRKVGYGTDEEVFRLLDMMALEVPGWKPGTQRGQAVQVQFNLPIQFKLDD